MNSKKNNFSDVSLKITNKKSDPNSRFSSILMIFFSILLILISNQFDALILGIFIGLPFIILGINRLLKANLMNWLFILQVRN